MSSSERRSKYDVKLRRIVILYAEEHGNRKAGRQFSISEAAVRSWRSDRDRLFATTATREAFRRPKTERYTELEAIVEHRKRTSERRTQDVLYNEKGILLSAGKDLCDCLDESCVGCFFPCPKCRSTKCGHECRQKRKYVYEYHEIVGTEIVIKNKSVSPS